MGLFELIIALLLAGALLTMWADKVGAPYPVLLALAGAVAAVIPGTPEVVLDPSLALALFVAPVLLDAAYDASLRDLRDNWAPVTSLVVVAVGVTVAAVAVAARWLGPLAGMPVMGWAAAITLGAIVAPPDAAAAATVLRKLRPPQRLMTILEGESLLNDASALLIYRVAGTAAMTGTVHWAGLPVMLLLTCGGGILLGFACARLQIRLGVSAGAEFATSVLVQFLSTFAVWLLADRLGLSPIITMVAYAMTIARAAPERTSGPRRIASYAVWEVAVFVLNVLAFALVGLQLKAILHRLGGELAGYLLFAVAIGAVVVATRIVPVMAFNAFARWRHPRAGERNGRQLARPTIGGGLLISWCGMRGVVTLAAALALPEDFPSHDIILFTAFGVTLGTLVLQGLTLGPLMRRLRLEDDGTVEHEVRLARRATLEAARRMLAERDGAVAGMLERKYAARLRTSDVAGEDEDGADRDLRRAAILARRQELSALRRRDEIGDAAFHAVEEEIDLDEVSADPRLRIVPAEGQEPGQAPGVT